MAETTARGTRSSAALILGAVLLAGCSAQPIPETPSEVPPVSSPAPELLLIDGCDDLLTAADLSAVVGDGIIDGDWSATYGGPAAPDLDGALSCRWVDSAESDAVQPTVEIVLQVIEDPGDGFAAGSAARLEQQELSGGLAPERGTFGAQSETFCQLAGPGPDCSFQGRANGLWFELRIATGERLVQQWTDSDYAIDLAGVRDHWASLAPSLVDRLNSGDGLQSTGLRVSASSTSCAELFDTAALTAATGLTVLDPDELLPAPDAESERLDERVAAASPTVIRSCRLDDAGERRSVSAMLGGQPWWSPDAADDEPVQLRWSISRVVEGGRLLHCQNVIEQRCALSTGVDGAVLTLESTTTFDEGDGGWSDPSALQTELDQVVASYRG